MGQKISAHAMRLKINNEWNSIWFDEGKNYVDRLEEDIKIQDFLKKQLQKAGLDRVCIRRSEKKLEIEVFVAKPGVVIGRGGDGIKQIQKLIETMTEDKVNVRISEVKNPDLSASIIASGIANGLQRRVPSKLLMRSYKEKAIEAGARGIKIIIAGRIGGAIQARSVKVTEGRLPLHTLRADIDYVSESAIVKNLCTFGIKVWVFKPKEKKEPEIGQKE